MNVDGFLAEPVPSGVRNDKMCWLSKLKMFRLRQSPGRTPETLTWGKNMGKGIPLLSERKLIDEVICVKLCEDCFEKD